MDLRELGRQLATTSWGWVAVTVAAHPLGLWFRALRWRYLFPPRSNPPGLVAANMIGYMANNVLPLRAGEVVRVYVAARRLRTERGLPAGESMWLAAATVVVERVLDSLSLVLILAVLVLVIPVPRPFQYAAAVLLVVDVIAAVVLITLLGAPGRARRLLAVLTWRWPPVERRALRGLDLVLVGLEGIGARRHALPLVAWTVVVWVLPALGAWAMLRAVHVDLPFVAGWTVIAFVGLGISVPSAPGYIGVWHAASVLALGIFGVAQPTAVGYALLYHASAFVPITLLGWIYLLREQMTLGEAVRAPDLPPSGR